MYTFVPRLASKEAWENRLFKGPFGSAKDVVEELANLKLRVEGRILLKPDEADSRPFGHLNELRYVLGRTPDSTISRIYLYGIGYFSNKG